MVTLFYVAVSKETAFRNFPTTEPRGLVGRESYWFQFSISNHSPSVIKLHAVEYCHLREDEGGECIEKLRAFRHKTAATLNTSSALSRHRSLSAIITLGFLQSATSSHKSRDQEHTFKRGVARSLSINCLQRRVSVLQSDKALRGTEKQAVL